MFLTVGDPYRDLAMNLGLTESPVCQTGSVEEVKHAQTLGPDDRFLGIFVKKRIITKNANQDPSSAQIPCR